MMKSPVSGDWPVASRTSSFYNLELAILIRVTLLDLRELLRNLA
jgi:hypothetical protein